MTKSKTASKTTAQASSCKAHKRIHDYFRQAKSGTWSWNAFESFYNKKGDCSNGKASDHYAKSLDAISKFCDNKCFIESCRILATRLRKDFSTAVSIHFNLSWCFMTITSNSTGSLSFLWEAFSGPLGQRVLCVLNLLGSRHPIRKTGRKDFILMGSVFWPPRSEGFACSKPPRF